MSAEAPRVGPYGSRQRPSGGPELRAWLFMRISGLVLLFLALGHFFIMHVFNSIHDIDFNFVSARYLNVLWRLYDLSMLWLAMIHGLNGLRTIWDDYLKDPLRGYVVHLTYWTGFIFLALGTYVVIFFKVPAGGAP